MLKNLLLLAIFTLFTVVALVIFNVYHNSTATKISEDLTKKVTPIDSSFDTQTLEKLKTREVIDVDLSEKVAVSSPSPVINVPIEPSTPSATVSPSP